MGQLTPRVGCLSFCLQKVLASALLDANGGVVLVLCRTNRKRRMFGFLKRRKAAQIQTACSVTKGAALQADTKLSIDVRHELVQGVINNVMRHNDFSLDTFTFVVFPVDRPLGVRELHIQLTTTDGGEALQQQAHLLQRQIQTGVNRYTHLFRADLDAFIISWRFPLIYKPHAVQGPSDSLKAANEARSNAVDRRLGPDRRRKYRSPPVATRYAAPFLPFDRGINYPPTELSPFR